MPRVVCEFGVEGSAFAESEPCPSLDVHIDVPLYLRGRPQRGCRLPVAEGGLRRGNLASSTRLSLHNAPRTDIPTGRVPNVGHGVVAWLGPVGCEPDLSIEPPAYPGAAKRSILQGRYHPKVQRFESLDLFLK